MSAINFEIELSIRESASWQPESRQDIDDKTLCRWAQLAAIVSAIGGAAALAMAGVLPAAVLTACAGGATTIFGSTVIATTGSIILGAEEKEQEEEIEYSDEIKNLKPIIPCVVIPIIEEVFFRSLLQGGIHTAVSWILPTAAITAFGIQLPVAALVSVVAAGVLFGMAHASNHPDNPQAALLHTITASFAGVCVLGPLYYAFGLWASALAHIVNNTIAIGLNEVVDALSEDKSVTTS